MADGSFNFELSIEFNGHMYGGNNAVIVVPPGQPNSLLIRWKNIGNQSVDLAYIIASPNPNNFGQLSGTTLPHAAIASNVSALGNQAHVPVMPGDSIEAQVLYDMPSAGGTKDLDFTGYAFAAIPQPGESPVIQKSQVVRLSAITILPPVTPPPASGGSMMPLVIGAGLLIIILASNSKGKK